MKSTWLGALMVPVTLGLATPARAVSSAELYRNQAYFCGRFEAHIRFAPGDGVVSSFFLWKSGSEVSGAYWNELDFEKVGEDCHLQTNALYGAPVGDHSQTTTVSGDLCAEYHTYGFEWTPTYIAWLVDGVERRRETGDAVTAFAQNASAGMQMHFNLWPGDASFGGTFDPAILPVRQYLSWVQYSSYADGVFTLQWREEFDGTTLPSGWATGSWASPKNYSTHFPANVGVVGGIAVLSLTADDARGFTGDPPPDDGSAGATGSGGGGGVAGGQGTTPKTGGASNTSGTTEDSGCSCRLRGKSRSASGSGLLALGLGAVLMSRRRTDPKDLP